jgi:MYXO-CTERM domain-containing protein
VIRRFTFNCLADLPVWLNEGLAMVAEGEEDASLMDELDAAIVEDRLLTIHQIESAFSVYRERAKLSYAQSYSLVRFLIDTYGQEKMLDLLTVFREGVTPGEAFTQVYGFDTYGLEDAWRAAIGAPALALDERDDGIPTPIPTLALAALPTAASTLAPTAEIDDTPLPVETEVVLADPGESLPVIPWIVWTGGALGLLALVMATVWRLRRI